MSRFFEFVITKVEVIKLSNLLHSLALMSDLYVVQQANFIWLNISNRNLFGYSLKSFDKYYKHLCSQRDLIKFIV